MPLRLFGGSTRARFCPGCERDLQLDAAFCPSCYMVFRPEGVLALRDFLQGARIPSDVYLLRRLQSQDPDAGPVVVAPAPAPPESSPAVEAPPPVLEPPPAPPPPEAEPSTIAAPDSILLPGPALKRLPAASDANAPRVNAKQGMEGLGGLLQYRKPLPPPAARPEEIPDLYAWMLEHDPVIPNNLTVLQAIHDAVFPRGPLHQVGYEQHVVLLAVDDATLFTSDEAHSLLLIQLASAYRRASEAYRKADGDETAVQRALWDMASLASRLRIGAWVFSTRYGQPPELLSPRQRELPLQFGES